MANTQNLTLSIILIVAASLVLLGTCLFVVTMSIIKWDFSVLGVKNVTNEHALSENFSSISVNTDTANVTVLPSPDGACRVICVEREKEIHTVSVTDGTLNIQLTDTREWYDHISIFSRPTSITLYLPRSEYDSVCIKADTGDINVEDISVGTLNICVSTGDVSAKSVSSDGEVSVGVTTGDACLTDLTCKNLTSSGSTGNITLKSVRASDSISLKRSTGDVTFDGCDAAALTVKTSTGNVRGSLLTEKIFSVKTSTGKVSVPDGTSGGTFDATTSTGDIIIEIK